MRTLTEIKDFVAKDHGYHDYETALKMFREGVISENSFNDFMDDVLKEVSKEALKNASENVKMKEGDRRPPLGSFDYIGTHYTVVDKQSILNESNIPNLI